jgi:flagellar assembly protein FliH
MMILQSESAAPVRLLGEAVQGVSRLEFLSFEPGVEEEIVDAMSEAVDLNASLRAEAMRAEAVRESEALEVRAQIEMARREAKAEARAEWEEEFETRLMEERARVARACEELGRERTKYFAAVEPEVVKLALAVAARVLHREAKMDPLLLAAAVRVVLSKVAEESATVLRVPSGDVEMWRSVFGSNEAVQLVGDERMKTGECAVETNVGKVELGVSAQLEEIEKGFFDLLEQRPS